MFHEGLRDHGWIEGKDLIVEYRFFETHAERAVGIRDADFQVIPTAWVLAAEAR
jgi:hypothetical protein